MVGAILYGCPLKKQRIRLSSKKTIKNNVIVILGFMPVNSWGLSTIICDDIINLTGF